MNIYQSNTYWKELGLFYFGNETRVQKTQQRKNQQTCIFVFVAYLTFPSSRSEHQLRYDNGDPCRIYGRFIEIQSNLRRKLFGRSFSNIDNVTVPIQFRRERQPQHFKRWFFLKNRPIHFYIGQTKQVELFHHWNQQAASCSSLQGQYLVDQIQVQKPILVADTA